MNAIRSGILTMGLIALFGTGCGPQEQTPTTEQAPATGQEQTGGQQVLLDEYLGGGEVKSQGNGCCAKCAGRVDAHLLWWVSENCTYQAQSWCAEPGKNRGSFQDAYWGSCRDDLF